MIPLPTYNFMCFPVLIEEYVWTKFIVFCHKKVTNMGKIKCSRINLMLCFRRCVFLLPLLVGWVSCFQHFQKEIPNGEIVPGPDNTGKWMGVGHKNAQGGGVRNPFGVDFNANGQVRGQGVIDILRHALVCVCVRGCVCEGVCV